MNQSVRRSLRRLIWLSVVASQTANAEDLTAAWRAALGQDPLLKAAESQVSAATADLDAARAGRLPGVSASAGITQFDDAPAFDFSGAGVPAVLPLFDGDSLRMADATVSLPL